MREAIILLHRKIDAERKCICGSKMDFYGDGWNCLRQAKLKEPNNMIVKLRDTKIHAILPNIVKTGYLVVRPNKEIKFDLSKCTNTY